jgi:hypothetical protein
MGSFTHERRSSHGDEYVVRRLRVLLIITILIGQCAFAAESFAIECTKNFGSGWENSFVGAEKYATALVSKSSDKIHLRDDALKIQAAYLLPGDEVIVLSKRKKLSCVLFLSDNYEQTIGWVPTKNLSTIVAPRQVDLWQGTFVRDKNGSKAHLNLKSGSLIGIGVVAIGTGNPVEVGREPNVADIEGTGELKGGVVHIGPSEGSKCEADFRRLGNRYLLIEESTPAQPIQVHECAGLGAAFSGLYLKTD